MKGRKNWARGYQLLVLTGFTVVLLNARGAMGDALVAWGRNDLGQLGNGTYINSNVPLAVSGLSSGVTTIAGGNLHSLAIQNGGMLAWGYNYDGELGNGTATGSRPAGISTPAAPIGMSSGVTAIAGGGYHSLAIQNGGVWAWGWNDYGQLGNGGPTGDSRYSYVPVAVSGLSSGVTAIAGGPEHSLAIQNGGLWAWGDNSIGELGNGSIATLSNVPVAVSGMSNGVTAIAAGGGYYSMAIKSGGILEWGDNDQGELGNGTTTNSNVPVAVSGMSSGVTAIAAGGAHGLAIKNGGVWAWGWNQYGQLGNGTTTNSDLPSQVDPADLTNIIAIAAGQFSSYAISADGSIWDWGDNSYGELGIGSNTSDFLTPRHLLPPDGYRFTSISGWGYSALATLAPVPEPTSLAMVLLACGGMMCRRRRA